MLEGVTDARRPSGTEMPAARRHTGPIIGVSSSESTTIWAARVQSAAIQGRGDRQRLIFGGAPRPREKQRPDWHAPIGPFL